MTRIGGVLLVLGILVLVITVLISVYWLSHKIKYDEVRLDRIEGNTREILKLIKEQCQTNAKRTMF